MEIQSKKFNRATRLSNHIWTVDAKMGGAVVQFQTGVFKKHYTPGDKKTIAIAGGKTAQIMKWGSLNDLPLVRQSLINDNNIVPQIMRTTRNLLLGKGLMYFKEVFNADGTKSIQELQKPQAALDFFEKTDFENEVLPALARDLIFNATMIPEFVRTKGGGIYSVEAKECAHSRSGIQNRKGKVDMWWWNGGWGNEARTMEFDTISLPVWNKEAKQPRFVWITGDRMFHDDYYNIPVWEGSRDWIELANLIPNWHISNINNGYAPRWHIEVPVDYFRDTRKYPDVDALTDEEYAAFETDMEFARLRFIERVNKVLGGIEGAGNTLFTDLEYSEALQKELPGIRITPLKAELNHEAFMKLFDATNVANVSAHGLPPVIASIQTPGRISAGAEVRNSLWLHIIVNTPYYRKLLSRIINFIHRENEWDKPLTGGQWGFSDVEITKLDENKAGHEEGTTN